jgi:hypothetical protein
MSACVAAQETRMRSIFCIRGGRAIPLILSALSVSMGVLLSGLGAMHRADAQGVLPPAPPAQTAPAAPRPVPVSTKATSSQPLASRPSTDRVEPSKAAAQTPTKLNFEILDGVLWGGATSQLLYVGFSVIFGHMVHNVLRFFASMGTGAIFNQAREFHELQQQRYTKARLSSSRFAAERMDLETVVMALGATPCTKVEAAGDVYDIRADDNDNVFALGRGLFRRAEKFVRA